MITKDINPVYQVKFPFYPLNFREVNRGPERLNRKAGKTGLTFRQIKEQWRSDAVTIAEEHKSDELSYPLKDDLRAVIRINPEWVIDFNNASIVHYLKYPLDALTKAQVYEDDSQIKSFECIIDYGTGAPVEITLWNI